MAALSAPQRRARLLTVARISLVSVIVSELITFVLLIILLGEILVEGLLIALICSAPISAWIADRQIRLRHIISLQHDRLSELNRALEERNAELDAFARAVAHDLKNPLAVVVGMADVVLAEPGIAADDRASEYIRSIHRSGERATEIIDGLLLLHGIRHERPELEAIDTEAAIDTAVATLGAAITDRRCVVNRSGEFPPVRAYRPWLVQVWVNLIANAIKYGGSPPTVELAARHAHGDVVRFEVKDNGGGVAEEDRDRIFREFERAGASDVEGHGLGLAIVSRIIDRLGGETGVAHAIDGGSVFWFTVPAA